jgi:hypothetical protein
MARGSDCLQSEPLSCLPTSLEVRYPVRLELAPTCVAHCEISSASQTEGRTEHRDGKMHVVTSELNFSFPSQGSDRQLTGEWRSWEELFDVEKARIQ